MESDVRPLVVGLGGTTRQGSSTELALAMALRSAAEAGADTRMFGGAELAALPHYSFDAARDSAIARDLVESARKASGIIISSPGYHGSISGLVKNAIDFLEETARDERSYLDGLPVGLIVTSYGWQAAGSTLGALRSIVHALRGWPTPFGVTIRVTPELFDGEKCGDPAICAQLELVGRQVVGFGQRFAPPRTDQSSVRR